MEVIANVLQKVKRTPIPEQGVAGRVVAPGLHNPIVDGITIENGRKYKYFERCLSKRMQASKKLALEIEKWEANCDSWESGGKKGPKPRKPKPVRPKRRGVEKPIEVVQLPVTIELCQQLVRESCYLHEAGTPLIEFSVVGEMLPTSSAVATVAMPGADVEKHAEQPTKAEQKPADVPAAPVTKLNANTATAEELMALPGIGKKLAEAIVSWRHAKGPFTTIGDVAAVNMKLTPAKLEPLITV